MSDTPSRTHYEDLTVGATHELGTVVADRSEMLAFAERYDPQPFHVDPEAAAATPFGGLIASGWYTAALCMRRLVEAELADAAALGALGVEELRWPAPVRPDDELALSTRVLSKRPSESRPGTGVVRIRLTATRVDPADAEGGPDGSAQADAAEGETVCSWTAAVLWAMADGPTPP